jgi:predicted ester cyclase
MKKFTGKDGFINYMIASHDALQNNHCEIITLVINSNNKSAAARIIIKGYHTGIFFGVNGCTSSSNTSTSTSSICNTSTNRNNNNNNIESSNTSTLTAVVVGTKGIVDGLHEISFDGTAFFTFNDDCSQIIELWALADKDTLKNQIGATTDSVFM